MKRNSPNIFAERSYAKHEVTSVSDPGRVKRLRTKTLPWTCKLPYIWRILFGAMCGIMILFGGMGLSLVAYYSAFVAQKNQTLNDTHVSITNSLIVRSSSIVGPVFMAFGFFLVMIAYVVYMEFRDKYFRYLPPDRMKNYSEKEVYAMIVQQFRRSYFHGIPLPIGNVTAATNTYPAGVHNTEDTDELLERLSPRFIKAEREADEALKIPHDSEVTLAYLAHIPAYASKDSSAFSQAFHNKNLYSPLKAQKPYDKSSAQKSTLSLKTDRRSTLMREEFGDRKSYSLDVPKVPADGSHENLAYTSEDDLLLLPTTGLTKNRAASFAISSDNESNLSESRYPSVIVHQAAVHNNERDYQSKTESAPNESLPYESVFNQTDFQTSTPAKAYSQFSRRFSMAYDGVNKKRKNRRASEFIDSKTIDRQNQHSKRRASEYGVVGVLSDTKPSSYRRPSEYGVVGALDYHPLVQPAGVHPAMEAPFQPRNRRCSEFGIIGNRLQSVTSPDEMVDTEYLPQGAYKTVVNIAPSEELPIGTFTGVTDRRKSLVSQCTVCHNDVLIDIDDTEVDSPGEDAEALSAPKLINDSYEDLLRRPSVSDRRSSFRNTRSKGSQRSLLETCLDNAYLRGSQRSMTEMLGPPGKYDERRVSFDPRMPVIERSRSCSSRLSIEDVFSENFTNARGTRYSPVLRSNQSLPGASSTSIDRTGSPKRHFLSPNDSLEYSRPCDMSPTYGESAFKDRRGSFDPRTAYAQSSASSRRKSFVGSDSDSMEFRISIDRVDNADPVITPNPLRRGRSLQVRSSRSKTTTKHQRQKSLGKTTTNPRTSVTFKCAIEELKHTGFSASQDDAFSHRKSSNFLTPDYQPR